MTASKPVSPQRSKPASPAARIHVNVGPVCNNNCLFCMEQDRHDRARVNGALTPARVREILERGVGAEEVCFTSGEPTLVPGLPRYVGWARRLGFGRISVMTNGRRLAYADYCASLVQAGVTHLYLSIHGHEARLHDGLVRTPGAFAQTVAGLDNAARQGVGLHTSTVVNRRNLPHLAESYRFLRARGVRQVVFNALQATGRAAEHFERLFPPYADIVEAYGRFLDALDEERPPVFLVDVPACATEALPDHNRGVLEQYVHYDVADDDLVQIPRTDHDTWQRSKRPACNNCLHDAVCPGVWNDYLAHHGWEGLEPVEA